MTSGYEDPAERMRRVREEMARQGAKRPAVDANGRPIEPAPEAEQSEPAGEPERRLPAPNPAQGSSAHGAPDDAPDDIAALAGLGRGHPEVHRLRQITERHAVQARLAQQHGGTARSVASPYRR